MGAHQQIFCSSWLADFLDTFPEELCSLCQLHRLLQVMNELRCTDDGEP
jgi:hypothetical protein